MLNILGKRYLFFALSLVLIVPGLIVMAVMGLPLAIDFTGGLLLEVNLTPSLPLPLPMSSSSTRNWESPTPMSRPAAITSSSSALLSWMMTPAPASSRP